MTDFVRSFPIYYFFFQAQFRVPDYISTQTEVSKSMRAILVDWLVEVQESFELNHETLYTAVKILDLYMANKVVNKEELQLVGATACLIACKIDERFVYIIILYIKEKIQRDPYGLLDTLYNNIVDVGFFVSYSFILGKCVYFDGYYMDFSLKF